MAKPKKQRGKTEPLPIADEDPQAVMVEAPLPLPPEDDLDIAAAVDEATSEDPIPAEARAAFQEEGPKRVVVWYATVFAATHRLHHVDHFAEFADQPEHKVGYWTKKFPDGSCGKMFTARALSKSQAVLQATDPYRPLDSASAHG